MNPVLLGLLGLCAGAFVLSRLTGVGSIPSITAAVRASLDDLIRGYPSTLPSPLERNATDAQWTLYAKWAMQGATAEKNERGNYGLFLLSPKTLNDLGFMNGNAWANGLSEEAFLADQGLQYQAFLKQSVNNANAIISRYRSILQAGVLPTGVVSQKQKTPITWNQDETNTPLEQQADPDDSSINDIVVPSAQPGTAANPNPTVTNTTATNPHDHRKPKAAVKGFVGDVTMPTGLGAPITDPAFVDKFLSEAITDYRNAHNGELPPSSHSWLDSVNDFLQGAMPAIASYLPGGAGQVTTAMKNIAASKKQDPNAYPLTKAVLALPNSAFGGTDAPAIQVSLSGLMAVAKQAGLTGLDKWISDPSAKAAYPFTTQAFTECNGMF